MFLVFGLASLAPACFAAHVYGHRFASAWSGLSRIRWTLLGTAAAYPLIATGLGLRLEAIFTLMGATIAPMAGAIAGDYLANRGDWPGPRRGVNPSGLVAWAAGLAVGLVPLVAGARGWSALERFQPASVFAFLAALGVFAALARVGVQPPTVPIPERAASS